MKTSHAIFALAMLCASAGAMAEDGASRVDKQMDDARIVAMQHYDETHDASQVAHQDNSGQQRTGDHAAQVEKQQG